MERRASFRGVSLTVFLLVLQAVLNQKFTDCFVLVFLDNQAGKTVSYYIRLILFDFKVMQTSQTPPPPTFFLPQSLKVVFREPLPLQPQAGSSPPPQLVSMYHHLESVINTACYNLWTGLL